MNWSVVWGEHGAFSARCTKEHIGVWRSINAAEMLVVSRQITISRNFCNFTRVSL